MSPSRAVLVTGCSSGIGEAAARRLLRAGFTVYATARDVSTLSALSAAGARVLELDVTSEASRSSAVAAVVAEHGAVSGLVNNAGYGQYGPVEEVPLAQWRAQFETNLFGAVALSQLVLPGMREQRWGRIVNVSSMGGRITLAGGGPYHASKYALEAFSNALRLEVATFGVRVSLVEPGPVSTSWSRGAIGSAADGLDEQGDGGAYAQFRVELAAQLAGAYAGGPAVSSPDRVARSVVRAVTSSRPRARYVVGPAAHALIALNGLLPDRAWDGLLSKVLPVPRGNAGE